MHLISRISTQTETDAIIADLTLGVSEQPYDLGFLFISSFDQSKLEEITEKLQKKLRVKHLLGCSCSGIVGHDSEVEGQPACSMILAQAEGAEIRPFYIDQAALDGLTTPELWYEFFDVFPNENPKFLALSDPFLIDINSFLDGINNAYPGCPVMGGMASGASQAGGNTLFLNSQKYTEGLIGLILTGPLRMETIVSQGCRPIGESYIVTKAQGNVIFELAGKPLYQVLGEVLSKASQREKMLAQDALFVGIAMDEYKHEMKRGDFLIRMLIGIDRQTGAGAIPDFVSPGQTVQFHVRDAISATEDLNELLKLQQSKHPSKYPEGALVFSCNGRGENLFQEKNHDIGIIQKHIGGKPVTGFFCAGEIGPVGGKNFIHGFTSSIALFYKNNG